MNQINKSHSQHQSNLESIVSDKEQRLFHLKNKDCLLYYLASEPLRHIQFLLKTKNKWLTIGDINGLEANYLLDKGQEAVASDISTVFLNEVKNEGLVKEISCQNVENITFEENAFDYTICKEAFHHFPRAYLGLYEMIRVSGKAAILLTEPIDILSKMPLLLFIKNKLDLIHPDLINKLWKNRYSFETVGNYVFKISEREIEKLSMGIGLPCVAIKEYNIYSKLQRTKDDTDKLFLNKLKRRRFIHNIICKLRILPYNSLCCILFKTMPDNDMLVDMKKEGYKILIFPKNPYLH